METQTGQTMTLQGKRCLHCGYDLRRPNMGCVAIRQDIPSFAWPFGQERHQRGLFGETSCPGCGAELSRLHHHGCPNAECILCGGLLVDCDCPAEAYGEGFTDL